MSSEMELFVKKLVDIEAIRFGEYVLKSGIKSPIYFDLRVIISYPELLRDASDLLWKLLPNSSNVDVLCGVPYTALPISTIMGIDQKLPILIRRKEAKSYGTKKIIEGNFTPGQNCLIVEDVVTMKDAVVVLNRNQGGEAALRDNDIQLHSLCHIPTLLQILYEAKKISPEIKKQVEDFVSDNQVYPPPIQVNDPFKMTYEDRFANSPNATLKNLCRIMVCKKSNLCIAADLDDSNELEKLIHAVGPHIICLKTHLDFFTNDQDQRKFIESLKHLSKKYDFLIFEDRKYADIGATVSKQYSKVVDFADIVTCHGLPGPGVITGLKSVAKDFSSALIVAQMSSDGNLASLDYAQQCAQMAEQNLDFVIGLVAQSRISQNAGLSQWTPGVNISAKTDGLAQKYVSPEDAILERKADVIIVGRYLLAYNDTSLYEVIKHHLKK
ncbi:UMPS [Lepeophtheirus salmonis]|uniref:Orotidine 5'-phosphate decarboxylase n=1 Tax=Lepeophtheirus salmonis TaxID=72036 RepID=A0A7R8HBP1_LEPSM|nr:UMPS [Lepeophtheirus salmonis]CAF2992527.1 UMPS [Lepeophtheirus salmonis]